MKIYRALIEIMGKLAELGIAKAQVNQQQRYNFRGIDDVYDTLAPLLAKHMVLVRPTYKEWKQDWVERETSRGKVEWCWARVRVTLTFISAEDGSEFTVEDIPGEGMDPGDKSTTKALSMAYKYAMFQTFCIPVQGDHDADATTPPPAPVKTQQNAPQTRVQPPREITRDDRVELTTAIMDAADDVELKTQCAKLFTWLPQLPKKTATDMAKIACEQRIKLAPDVMDESVRHMIQAFADKKAITLADAAKFLAEWDAKCPNGTPAEA